jgi:uracil phosphoribosyltransferase
MIHNDPKALYLSQLRDREIEMPAFRKAAHQLIHLLAHEALSHLDTKDPITLVPILRSGLSMLPVFLHYFPNASIGILGLQRDKKTAETMQYYCNMPPLTPEHRVIILDPMIATGNTARTAFDIILKHVPIEHTLFVGIISAAQGVNAIKKAHPKAQLIVAGQDAHLNDKNFIVPGLGDFGDRYFGTVE